MNNQWFVFLLIGLTYGCSYLDSGKDATYSTVVVTDTIEILIDSEIQDDLVFPSFIRTVPDYFLIYDSDPQNQKILKFSYDGENIFSFGGTGRGPGEFQSLTNYWVREDHYLLYDYNGGKMIRYDLDGSFLDEFPVQVGELPMNIEFLDDDFVVHAANYTENSLLQISNLKTGETDFFGKAIAGESDRHLSNEDLRNMILSGRVPNYMLHRLSVGVNESGIFSFQNATALLQKFNTSGELLWEKDLNLPPVNDVYEDFIDQNKEGEFIYPLTYASGIHVNDFGSAILLNTTQEKPVTVIWVPNDGSHIELIEYPDIERHPTFPLRFRVAPEHSAILFVHSLAGKVFKADWPIEYDSLE